MTFSQTVTVASVPARGDTSAVAIGGSVAATGAADRLPLAAVDDDLDGAHGRYGCAGLDLVGDGLVEEIGHLLRGISGREPFCSVWAHDGVRVPGSAKRCRAACVWTVGATSRVCHVPERLERVQELAKLCLLASGSKTLALKLRTQALTKSVVPGANRWAF